jgi:outer membrane protein OmpA-like peptidoglycan-associated protein
MEKIHTRQINMKNHFCHRLGAIFLLLWLAAPGAGQIRPGAQFLQFMPGARQQGMAGSLTGVLDDMHAIYANPGATGFLREWQWSATYAGWIADVYSASLIYGQRVHTPWSRQTRFAVSAAYQGMPDFDSSDRAAPMVSANDVIFAASFGEALNERLAFGANLKYLRSRLAEFDAASWVVDTGVLFRTARFRLLNTGKGLFDYGIFSAGVAVTQLGPSLDFITTDTPLPRTFRAGLAFNAGTHEGWQWQFTADYRNVREIGGFLSFGSEIAWSQILALRGGYSFHDNLLSHFSFGLTLRLDDLRAPTEVLPGRNKAIRLDMASVTDNFLFARNYRGSVTHHAIGPEGFDFIAPASGALIQSDSVALAWQTTRDPDLYDDVGFWLLVDRDSLKMAEVVRGAERSSNALFNTLDNFAFLVNQKISATEFQLRDLEGGDYYWTVVAYDRDRHVRLAGGRHRHIRHFRIVAPDVQITAITFDYSPWITEDDYQGSLQIAVKNTGLSAAKNIALALVDSFAVAANGQTKPLAQIVIERLQAGEVDTIKLEWRTSQPGLHHLMAQLDAENRLRESNETNNRLSGAFYTIPKGRLAAPDTAVAFNLSRLAYEVPLIVEICFERSSAQVLPDYLRRGTPDPPLAILAARLQAHPNLKISVQGFADPNSGEHEVELANARAAAVRDSLLGLGVQREQILLVTGEALPLRKTPKDSNDARWVLEERRFVRITADSASESELFQLVAFDVTDSLPSPVVFNSAIAGAVPFKNGVLQIASGELQDGIALNAAIDGANLLQAIEWQPTRASGKTGATWAEKNVAYDLVLADSLGRQFRTLPRQTFLATASVLREQRVAWPLKFQGTDPLYDFYWDKLLVHINRMLAAPDMRMRFSGHACAIGPEPVNLRLSQQRAEAFHQGFLRQIKARYPQVYEKLLPRLDPAKGFGETSPLSIERLNGARLMIGDNQKPLGRKLNRRLEIEFYYPQKRLTSLR